MEPETLTVTINERDGVTAMLYLASKKERAGVTVILGHGAGANQLSPFMRLFASGLAQRGFDTMTFNFLYMEQGRRVPDPKQKLESCYRAVIQAAQQHKKLKGNRVVIGGKSMGGRIASQVAATAGFSLECGDVSTPRGLPAWGPRLSPLSKALTSQRTPNLAKAPKELREAPIEGKTPGAIKNGIAALVLLGYPLHPPGKPETLRDAHLEHIRAPMLMVQGSRDAFGTPDELNEVIKRLHLPATLHVIEGGDHSFKVPKSLGVPQPQLYENVMDEIARWLRMKLS